MLLEEGQYEELCLDGQESICAARQNKLDAIFTLAQFFLSFVSLPVGVLVDTAPKPVYFAIAGILEIAGLLLFAVSESSTNKEEESSFATNTTRDYFLPAYSLLAVGGCLTMLGAFPASFLLPKYQAYFLASTACLFDGSSILFWAFYQLHHYFGYNRQQIFTGWVGVAVVVYSSLIICWRHLETNDWQKVIAKEKEISSEAETEEESRRLVNGDFNNVEGNKEEETTNNNDRYLRSIQQRNLHSLGVWEQLQTWEFGLVVLFASCQMIRCNFFIMTVDGFLSSIGDNDQSYANLFGWILPCGIVFVPFIERTITSWGILKTLHFTNGLGFLFGVLLWVPLLHVQLPNFGIFTCFRAYLYATLNSFIALTFGVKTTGRIIGFVFTTAAVVTLLQYPLSVWTNRVGNFLPANMLLVLVLGVVPVFASLGYERYYLQKNSDKNSKNKDGTNLLHQNKIKYGTTDP